VKRSQTTPALWQVEWAGTILFSSKRKPLVIDYANAFAKQIGTKVRVDS
jgi:hypothetical protein